MKCDVLFWSLVTSKWGNNNITIVDLLYQQFYTGSKNEPTSEEQEFMKTLFTSKTFVLNEYRYHRITRKGDFGDGDNKLRWHA